MLTISEYLENNTVEEKDAVADFEALYELYVNQGGLVNRIRFESYLIRQGYKITTRAIRAPNKRVVGLRMRGDDE